MLDVANGNGNKTKISVSSRFQRLLLFSPRILKAQCYNAKLISKTGHYSIPQFACLTHPCVFVKEAISNLIVPFLITSFYVPVTKGHSNLFARENGNCVLLMKCFDLSFMFETYQLPVRYGFLSVQHQVSGAILPPEKCTIFHFYLKEENYTR